LRELSEEEKRAVINEVYGETECAACNKGFTDPYDILRVEYLTGVDEKTNFFRYQTDHYDLCSLECLLKWTWNSIIPTALYFPVDAPESEKELELQRTLEKIEEKQKELLRLSRCVNEMDK